jgi:hypothetical protein
MATADVSPAAEDVDEGPDDGAGSEDDTGAEDEAGGTVVVVTAVG